MRRLATLAFLLATASSADAANPYPVPAGARSVALGYRSQWIEAAKRNPFFYHVEPGMAVDKMEVLDGFANVMLIGPDVVRFAESGKMDPFDFASRILYEFPMMVEGVHVGNLVIRARTDADADTAGAYVVSGITGPGGVVQRAVDRAGGYARAETFSVVTFSDESFAGVFLRLAVADGIQYAPPSASGPFFFIGTAVFLSAEQAVPVIRAQILERARASAEPGK